MVGEDALMGQSLDTVTRFYERYNQNDFDGATALFKPNIRAFDPAAGAMHGIEAWRAYNALFKIAVPDGRLELDTAVEQGEQVVVRGRYTGTHTGPLASPEGEIPPTGRSIDLHFADCFTVENGLVSQHRVYYDQMELLGQLGLIPAATEG
jgi:predicted ester cyclase